MATPEDPKPRRRRATRLALVALGVLAPLVLAEVAVRVRARLSGQPYSAEATEKEMKNLLASMTVSRLQGLRKDVEERSEHQSESAARSKKPEGWKTPETGALTLHPYLGFDWAENVAELGRDLEYFRGAESERNFDVLVVGGSVAGGFGLNGADELVAVLGADPAFQDRPVVVHGYGRGGYKEPQQLLLVSYLFVLGFKPDLVLNIDGFNECALANTNIEHGVHPAYPSVAHWAHLASNQRTDRTALDFLMDMRARQRAAADLAGRVRAWHLEESALAGALACMRLRELHSQYVEIGQRYVDYLANAKDAAIEGPPLTSDAGEARELMLDTWFESSRSLDALCRARSIPYVHVLQPTLTDPGSKPLTAEEVEGGTCPDSWRDGVLFGYPRMRELGAKLRELGVHFVDATQLFHEVSEKLYFDACHFDQRGAAMLARMIAAEIIALERAPH